MANPPIIDSHARFGAAFAFILPALIYLTLALFPDWWGPEARTRLLFQFFVVEISAGILIGAVGQLTVHGSAISAAIGSAIVLIAVVGGLGLTWCTTGSLALTALVGWPLLPRVVEAIRLARGGRWLGGMLVREAFVGLAGCAVIGFGYLSLMSPGPDDPPGTSSVPPPIGLTATAMALHYALLAYFSGNQRGLKPWALPEDSYQ